MKLFTGIPAFCLAVTLLAFTAGCGGNTGKAKEYVQAGNNMMNNIKGESIGLEEIGNEINETIKAIFSGNIPPSADVKKKADEFEAGAGKIEKYAAKATAEYKKILALQGVPLYREYAGKAIEYIETVTGLYKKYGEMLRYVSETLEQYESGADIDSTVFSADLQNAFNEMGQIGVKAEEINEERSRLEKENNL